VVLTGGSTTVAEGGAGDSLTVALARRPQASVTLTISGGSDLLLALDGSGVAPSRSIVFTTADWDSARAIIVTAVDDGILEGSELAGLSFTLSSADPAYNGLVVSPLPVVVLDGKVSPPTSPPPQPPHAPPVLMPGMKESWGAMSVGGDAVFARASGELASIGYTAGGLLVTWHDGTSALISGAANIAFPDGSLIFGGASAAARALRAYQALQGANPTAEAVAHTATLLEQGVPMIAVTASLLSMNTWTSRAGALSPQQQLQLIYKSVIGYSPPQGALDGLVGAATSGVSLAALAAMLIDTPEAVAFSDQQNPAGVWLIDVTRRSIVRAYDAVLDSAPDPAALARWALLLDSGAVTVDGIYHYLAATDIFQARHGGQSNAEFVASAYRQALERSATTAELNWSTQLLDRGMASRIEIMRSLGEAQMEIGQGPDGAGHAQATTYAAVQSAGQILRPGQSLAETAVSAGGQAVATRASADLARIDVAPDGMVLHWLDGSHVRIAPVENLTLADGRLELDGSSPAAVLARLYEATIGFSPGGWHVATFVSMLNSGIPLEAMAEMFLLTSEAQARLAGLAPAAQVSAVYTTLIGHAPAPEALAYLTSIIPQGFGLAYIASWLAQLPEAAAAFEISHSTGVWVPDLAAATVVRAFDAMLDTVPDAGSLLIWKAAVTQPGMLALLYETLMNTDMHKVLYADFSEEAWVAGHYRAALERDASPGELAHSTALVTSGAVSHLAMAMAIGELQPLPDPARYATASIDLL
jgi:hypothetical protein